MSLQVNCVDSHLGRPHTTDFSRCNYRTAQMKHTGVYGSASTSDCLIVEMKKSQHVPFQERHYCRLTTACTNETQINGCARTVDCRLLFSFWNQRRPRPKNLLLLRRSRRCMIVKYWFRKLKDVLLCTTVRWKNTAIRVWKKGCGEKCARQSFVSGCS